MKFIWEQHDIRPGQKVSCTTADNGTTLIGYDPASKTGSHYLLVLLDDGCVVLKGQSSSMRKATARFPSQPKRAN